MSVRWAYSVVLPLGETLIKRLCRFLQAPLP